MRIDVFADSDSRWKWGALLARQIDGDAELHAHFLRGRATPTRRQLEEVGVRPDFAREVTMAELLADSGLRTADVVILAGVGGTIASALHGLRRAWGDAPRRPVVVTGYVGVVYEKLTDGLLLRAGADVVLANSAADVDRFRAVYEPLGVDPDSVVRTALPFLGGAPYEPAASERGERRYTVCFVTQPSSPADRAERMYLIRRAAEHARRHPERDVLVKLRSRPGEHTTHIEEYPYQHLVRRLPNGAPPNLQLVYGNMSDVLDRTDLCVTVSSTAALEAMYRGIPTAVLTDLGVREVLGNHQFVGSGCATSWDAIDAGAAPVADPAWLRRHGVDDDEPFRALRERIGELRAAEALPPLRPYYTVENAGGYLPRILARNGLDPQGVPLRGFNDSAAAQAGPVPAAQRVVREVVRNGARTAYRVAVQRVAPAVRRWGQL
ncbi:DUF6716 putative glycosyltransferase [Allostreptomyces psammosilenae]|nr:DUF6716 putative glycosyltransferase [Allostreptomyces psammosilenae]